MSLGIYISEAGHDATTASAKNLVFSSDFKTPKIYTSGDFSITTDASGNATSSVAHPLNYAPGFYIFRKGTTKANIMDASTHANVFTPNNETFDVWWDHSQDLGCYSDTSSLKYIASGAGINTTYDFRHYLLLDPSETTNASGDFESLFGIRTTMAGFDALTGKIYQTGIDSKYNTFSYHKGLMGSYNLTLPAVFASAISDTDVEEGTYVDIYHGLEFAPFYIAYMEIGAELYEIPMARAWSDISLDYYWAVNSWCDSTRVRLSFWRRCNHNLFSFPNSLSEETVTVKWIISKEALSG